MKRTIQRFRGGRGIIMKELKLTKYVQTNATVLDNEFIDHYMVRANGEYVKVYLLLLRHMNQSSGYLSVSELADLLECTEKDILRALRYWKSEDCSIIWMTLRMIPHQRARLLHRQPLLDYTMCSPAI